MTEALERAARAVRRRQFERTRRLSSFDPNVPPTEEEIDNAASVIATLRDPPDDIIHKVRNALPNFTYGNIRAALRAAVDAVLGEKS